jgi:5-methylcytosine-specific restriction protein A
MKAKVMARHSGQVEAAHFLVGHKYKRIDLHNHLGGQRQGGISTPTQYPIILLFTGQQGQEYGYGDDWTSEGLFEYVGEGQVGDMEFTRGNRAIRDHLKDHRTLHLFEYLRDRRVRYVGKMTLAGWHYRTGSDRTRKQRRVIVFELVPSESLDPERTPGTTAERALRGLDVKSLRQKALADATPAGTPKKRLAQAWERSVAIRLYVLKRANGQCEACGSAAPFATPDDQPYLEAHHILRLSDGGPDHPESVAAVCPNCHREAHYGKGASDLNNDLLRSIKAKELDS